MKAHCFERLKLLLSVYVLVLMLLSCTSPENENKVPVVSPPTLTSKPIGIVTESSTSISDNNQESGLNVEPSEQIGDGVIFEPIWSPAGDTLIVTGSLGLWLYNPDSLSSPPRLLSQYRKPVAFSPEGQIVVSGNAEGLLSLWDSETGLSFATLQHQPDYRGFVVAFSPDGSTVVSANYGGPLRLWDAATGALKEEHPYSNIIALGFESDSSLLVALAREPNNLEVWDVDSNALVTSLSGHKSSVLNAAFSANSNLLLSTEGYGHTLIWNITTHQAIETLELTSVASLSDDSNLLAWTSMGHPEATDTLVNVKNLRTQAIIEFGFPRMAIKSLAFSPGEKDLAIVTSDTVLICNLSSHDCRKTEGNFLESIVSISVSGDGQRIAFSQEYPRSEQIQVWDITTGEQLNTWEAPSAVNPVFFERNGNNLFSADMGRIRLWDINTGEQITSYSGFNDIRSAVFNQDGTVLACGGTILVNDGAQNFIRFWDLEKRELVRPDIETMAGMASDLAFLTPKDDRLASVSLYQSTVQIWDIPRGRLITSLNASSEILSIDADPLGRYLAAGTQNSLLIWNIETGSLLQEIKTNSQVLDLEFSPQGTVLAYSADASISVLDLETFTPIQNLVGHQDIVTQLAFTPDGQHIFSGSADGTLCGWWLAS